MEKHFYKHCLREVFSVALGCVLLAGYTATAKEALSMPKCETVLDVGKVGTADHVPNGTRFWKDVPYITNGHERNVLDLYVPASDKPLPLLVWVHGGAWVAGDKSEGFLNRYLTQGYAVASINYRFSQHAIFPAQLEDCKAAIRWLRAHAETAGIDPNRIGVSGASAGGHLVALLGSTGKEKKYDVGEYTDVSSEVQAVCDFFGPTDFEHYDFEKTIFKVDAKDNPLWLLVGGNPNASKDDKEALAKLMLAIQDVSPVTHVTKDHAPILILHGNKDNLVPLNQSEYYLNALKKNNVESALYVVDGHGHGFLGENIWRIMDTFFERHLKPEKTGIGYRELLPKP